MDLSDEDYLKTLKETIDMSASNNMKFRIHTMSLFPFLIGIGRSKTMRVSTNRFNIIFCQVFNYCKVS